MQILECTFGSDKYHCQLVILDTAKRSVNGILLLQRFKQTHSEKSK